MAIRPQGIIIAHDLKSRFDIFTVSFIIETSFVSLYAQIKFTVVSVSFTLYQVKNKVYFVNQQSVPHPLFKIWLYLLKLLCDSLKIYLHGSYFFNLDDIVRGFYPFMQWNLRAIRKGQFAFGLRR